MARHSLVVGIVLAVAGCTDGGDRARTKPAPQPVVEDVAEPLLGEAPIEVSIIRIGVEPTQLSRPRWVGRARLSGTSVVEYSVLAKTTCKVDEGRVTQVEYVTVGDFRSNVGRLEDGKEFDFKVLASDFTPDEIEACEMRLVMMDRDEAVLRPTLSTRVCFADDAASIGRCRPRIARYPKRFALEHFDFNPESNTFDAVVAIGAPMRATEAMLFKATCRRKGASGPITSVGTWRGRQSWGLRAPGETGRERGFVPRPVADGADTCLFEALRVDTARNNPREDWETGSTVMHTVGRHCWSNTGTANACESMLADPAPAQERPPRSLLDFTLTRVDSGEVEIRAAVRVGATSNVSNFRAVAECGLRSDTIDLDPSAAAIALDRGDTVALRGSLFTSAKNCRVALQAPDNAGTLGVRCIGDDGPRPCAPPA